MPAASKPSGGLVAVRAKDLFIGTPGPMAFENLIHPDEYQGSKSFSVTIHQNVPQVQRLGELIDAQVLALWDKFLEAAEEEGKKPPSGGWVAPVGADWVTDHLKEPGAKSKVKDPTVKWKNGAEYKDRDGELRLKTMRAYDAGHSEIDLASLRLGQGSIIQPVLIPGLFVSALIKQPQPSFKLQGVVVIELKQRGGGWGGLGGSVRDEDMDLAGTGTATDLSAYAKGAATQASARGPQHDADLDEELPF